jgi:Fe-S cluster assembly protein SufD|tara:strand:+ start:1061 stop:2383 length:1323 start_codon:yes stop_codon:yes gene_type:complete
MSNTLISDAPSNFDEAFLMRQAQNELLPEWFQTMQAEAWERYKQLPTPNRTSKNWRFSNLKSLADLDRFEPSPFAAVENEEIVEKSNRLKNVAGRFVFIDDNLAAPRYLDPELEKQGVVFTTLFDALNQHEALVKKYFMRQSPRLGSEKFEALHLALLRNGLFVYIPKGLEIDRPFVVANWSQASGSAIFPHTHFICDENAKATLVEFQESASPETENLVIANAHVFAENGAKPRHDIIQNWNTNTLSFQLNTHNAERDVESRGILINIGSKQARQEVHGEIFGSGSDVNLYSLNVPTKDQFFDQRTLQTHIAPNSRSNLLYKNVLQDSAKTIFSGLIIVEEEAQQTDAYQTNNNLLLSEKVEANSLPGLEINANDVKCSHGATSGQIDDSNIFYFLARGIPRKKAEELLVFGFFEEIIEKFKIEDLRDYIRELVQQKFR